MLSVAPSNEEGNTSFCTAHFTNARRSLRLSPSNYKHDVLLLSRHSRAAHRTHLEHMTPLVVSREHGDTKLRQGQFN